MKRENLSYIQRVLATALTILTIVAIFTSTVDPFSIFGIQINGFNAIKPAFNNNTQVSKTSEVKRLKPNALILGTSRANQGYDPDYEGWINNSLQRYNFATGGADSRRIWRYFQHAAHFQPIEQALVGLDFLSFNIYRFRTDYEPFLAVNSQGQAQHWYQFPFNWFPYLLSYDAIASSLKTLTHQSPSNNKFLPNGFKLSSSTTSGLRKDFLRVCERFVTGVYLPGPSRKYALVNPTTQESSLVYYKNLLDTAYQNHTDLRLVINPLHAYLTEVVDHLDLWETLETWKRELVLINEETAALYGVPPFPLWDFSGYNSITTYPTAKNNKEQNVNHPYHEASHFTRDVGNLVLDRVFGYERDEHRVPDDFGVLLSRQNIETHLSNIRDAQMRYRQSHAEEVRDVREAVIHALEHRPESSNLAEEGFLED